MEPINISSVIQSVLIQLYSTRDGRARTLVVELPAHSQYVVADPQYLAGTLTGLIHDFARNSERHARILVSIEREGEDTVLRVRELQSLRERIMRLAAAHAPLVAGSSQFR
ncbi:MAG: hypothetical protein WDO56_15050 [Gammaproteobacteria bacterium]